jgi:hypothetical protein
VSSDLIEIKARTKTGVVQTFSVSEILEINGKPYQSSQDFTDLREHMIHMDGRLTALKTILTKGD